MRYDLPFFDDEHRRLAADLEAWCTEHLAVEEAEEVDAACRELVRQLGEAGWLRYCVPGAFGGPRAAVDARSLCIIRETLAYHAGLADFAFAMQGLGSGAITLAGTPAQQERYLPGVASGALLAAFALSEPEAGSDVAALSTTATRTASSAASR